MNLFLLLAGILTGTVSIALLWPLLRQQKAQAAARWLAILVALLLPLLTIALYLIHATPQQALSWPPAVVNEQRNELRDIALHLHDTPEDIESWLLLSRYHLQRQDSQEAMRTLQQGMRKNGAHADLLLGMADAALQQDPTAAVLHHVEQALELDPYNRDGLWLAAVLARRDGQLEQAEAYRQRFRALPRDQAATTGDDKDRTTADDDSKDIVLNISLAPALQSQVTPQTTLFVVVRSSDGPPMPLIALRHSAADLPLQLRLNNRLSLLPERLLLAHQPWDIIARLSLQGSTEAQPGDLEGRLQTVTAADQPLNLIIEQQR